MDSKLKIFQIITSVQLGGAEVVAFNLVEECQRLCPDKFEFTIIELFASKSTFAIEKKKELQEKNIRVLTLSRFSKRKSLIFAPLKLNRILRQENPDIVHSHTDLPDFVLASALICLNKKRKVKLQIVRSIHNTELWPKYKRIAKYVESAYMEDYVIGVSGAAVEAYEKLRKQLCLEETPHKSVIYNGCPIPDNSSLGIELGVNKINIGICGRLETQKGIDFLLSYLKRNNHQFSNDINFYFVGDGTLKSQVKELVICNDNIEVHDPIVGIPNKLHAFDYILMPSRFEGLGLMSIEASLAKVPVIASKVDGLKETLPHDWALFFDLEKEGTLTGVLTKIQCKSIDKKQLGEKSFKFALKCFAVQQMAKKYAQIYCEREF